MGVKSEYSNWIKKQIDDMGLMEKVDYTFGLTLKSNQTSGRGGDRRSLTYLLKVSTVKEVAMVARVKKVGASNLTKGVFDSPSKSNRQYGWLFQARHLVTIKD